MGLADGGGRWDLEAEFERTTALELCCAREEEELWENKRESNKFLS